MGPFSDSFSGCSAFQCEGKVASCAKALKGPLPWTLLAAALQTTQGVPTAVLHTVTEPAAPGYAEAHCLGHCLAYGTSAYSAALHALNVQLPQLASVCTLSCRRQCLP